MNVYHNLLQGASERPVAWLFAREQLRRARRGEAVLEAHSRLGVALHSEIKMRLFNVLGFVMTYILWCIMVSATRPHCSRFVACAC